MGLRRTIKHPGTGRWVLLIVGALIAFKALLGEPAGRLAQHGQKLAAFAAKSPTHRMAVLELRKCKPIDEACSTAAMVSLDPAARRELVDLMAPQAPLQLRFDLHPPPSAGGQHGQQVPHRQS